MYVLLYQKNIISIFVEEFNKFIITKIYILLKNLLKQSIYTLLVEYNTKIPGIKVAS